MRPAHWWGIIVFLFAVIIVLAVVLFAVPAPAHAPTSATSTPVSTVEPLDTRVVVHSPVENATVGQTFAITGEAPGNWYFEAVFPIQVRDKDNNKIGQTQGQAQSDWMTTSQVPFSATMTLDTVYHGPGTLVLLRDNPSGLPENDDSLEVPIVVQ